MYRVLIVVCVLALITGVVMFYINGGHGDSEYVTPNNETDHIENGIHVRTGLVDAPGLKETVKNCTYCHSAKLVVQNRMSAERWHATIRWMQETQGLWPLGEKEDIIVDYLVTNYPPQKKGRRQALTDVEWYELNP